MGRKAHGDGQRREQAPKQPRGFARGHGVHHQQRFGRGAPHQLGTGRDRKESGTRRGRLTDLAPEDLAELGNVETAGDIDRRVEGLDEASGFGAAMEGAPARGLVLEVRKGNFLTRMLTQPELVAGDKVWRRGDVLRTFVRGTLQQFDLGLSSLVAPGDEIETIVPPLAESGELVQTERHAILTQVHPRRNEFRRLHPSGRAVQTLAANIDRVLIVSSAAEPDFRPGFVDRVLVCAAASNVPVALVVNKIDLGLLEPDADLLEVYRGLGLPVFLVSVLDSAAPQGDFEALCTLLAGSRTLLCGHSGVGKSTLLLALDPSLPAEDIRISEVSTVTGKGSHTTTHGKLYELALKSTTENAPPTQVIDTPGVREFTPADTDRRNLWGWFPEIARLQGQCGFADCTHTIEKKCAVLAAVEAGEIHPRRHQSYVRIYETLPN